MQNNLHQESSAGTDFKDKKIIFFGTSLFAVCVLENLKSLGFVPDAVVTTIDKPSGRKMIMTAPPAKDWAQQNNIPVYQFEKLREAQMPFDADLFIVASYGKIIPQSLLDQPKFGALNIHPSLLPEYRGPSPIQTTILDDHRNTGVTIIKMDAEMDHGPIVAIKSIPFTDENWPPRVEEFKSVMATEAAKMLLKILPQWFAGTAKTLEQDHSKATFTKKIMNADGEINLNGDPWKNYLKIQAFSGWPRTFFFVEKTNNPSTNSSEIETTKKIRVTIQSASFDRENKVLKIERVIPEGGKEMSYDDFLRGHNRTTNNI